MQNLTNFSTLNESDLILLAKNSSQENILLELSKSIYTTVRKCVAKNINSSKNIINRLANDSALNVSYFANSNPNCTNKREMLKPSHPCILCEVDESDYKEVCPSCTKISF